MRNKTEKIIEPKYLRYVTRNLRKIDGQWVYGVFSSNSYGDKNEAIQNTRPGGYVYDLLTKHKNSTFSCVTVYEHSIKWPE